MPRRRKAPWSERSIAARSRKGRGRGIGASYKPWLTVRDVPSLGRRHRIPGILISRAHHLLSDLEYQIFMMLEYCGLWSDLQEQFPLDRTEARAVAAGLSVRYPIYPGTSVPQVMTSDILLTAHNGARRVVSIKYTDALNEPGSGRLHDLLEIEYRYWARQDTHWSLATERHVDPTTIQNLEWLRYLSDPQPLSVMPSLCDEFSVAFLERWEAGRSLKSILDSVHHDLPDRFSRPLIDLFRMSVFCKAIRCDLSKGSLEAIQPVFLL